MEDFAKANGEVMRFQKQRVTELTFINKKSDSLNSRAIDENNDI